MPARESSISKAFSFPADGLMNSHAPGPKPNAPDPISIDALPRLAGLFVLGLAVLVLIGWVTDTIRLETLWVSRVTIKPNTAIALGLCSLGLIFAPRKGDESFPRRVTASTLSALAALLALMTVLEYAGHWDFGIDQLFLAVPEDAKQTATPGRMALITASALAALGTGILLNINRVSRTAGICQLLMLAAAALALTSLLGYAYGAIPTVGLGQGVQIAIPTAVAVLVVSLGALALRPEIGWVATVTSRTAGGALARLLLPFAFVVPLMLGTFRAVGHLFAPFSVGTQTAIVAVLTMLSFGAIIWRTAVSLDVADSKRRIAEEERVALVSREEAARARAEAESAARGVAERAREEAELAARQRAEALKLLEVVLSSAPIGFAVLDRQCRYVRVNKMLADMHGVPEEDHVGRSVEDFVPEIAASIESSVTRVFSTNKPILNVQLEIGGAAAQREARDARHLLVSFYPVADAAGATVAVGAVLLDTTNVRFLEEQLTQSQKMEAVGQLAGGVAHDFNNILTVITVYSALLLEDMGADDPKREEIQEIKQAAERASVLTRQLLAFSRKQVIQPRHISLNDVVRGVGRMLPRLIGEDITIETALEDDLPLVNADPGQLEQVVINLAVNARDAMPNGGRLRIVTRIADLDVETAERRLGAAEGRYVTLSVSDTGTGMSPEVQRHIFEPFFTTKESGRGTGLGLSTVFGIVKQSSGDITVYSEIGEGTTFNLYFPALASDARPDRQAGQAAPPRGGSETVLLVEDDARLILLSEKILARLGYTVLLARNGGEAIETIESHGEDIAIVVTDVVMPILGGRPLVERIRSLRPDLPVLFMSGYTNDEVTRRGILEGEVPFIQKPFTPDDFGRKIREVLDSVMTA